MIINYTATNIDKKGLKYTMDGGADGHDLNSSLDEIIHNFIDMESDDIKIYYSPDNFWSFNFNINKNMRDIKKSLRNGVSLYNTKGDVGIKDISKFGKGIKCAAHCIFPNGKMIFGLIKDTKLYMAVYNQGIIDSVEPGTEDSTNLENLYQEIVDIDILNNNGFLIITNEESDDYRKIFTEYNEYISEELYEDEKEDVEYNRLTISVQNHIAICYNPLLNKNFEDGEYLNYSDINISLNGEDIKPFSHTCFSSENIDDNEEIDYAVEYISVIPYRELENGKDKYYLNYMYFKEKNNQFSFDDDGKKTEPPNLEGYGLNESDVIECTIRLTKLSDTSQKRYISEDYYQYFEKTKNCSYFIYRNGVCSDTSFIPFEGKYGFRPTDAPQMRGEIHTDNEFDEIINPGSNKSLVKPDNIFINKCQALAKYVQKEKFLKKYVQKSVKKILEGKEYTVTPNNTVLSITTGEKLGVIKGDQVRWDKLSGLKAKAKQEIMSKTNNKTKLFSDPVHKYTDIKLPKNSDFRLFTTDPENPEKNDVFVLSKREYGMVTSGDIDPDIFNDDDKLNDKKISIYKERLNDLNNKIIQDYTIISTTTGQIIDLSNIKFIPNDS